MHVSVCASSTLFKRTLKMSSSSILKSPEVSRASKWASNQAGKQAGKQASKPASKQAARGHSVGAMPCRGLY